MSGHAKVEDFSSSVDDHKASVQHAESNGGNDDEVHRGDAVLVITKECLLALVLVVVRLSHWKISADSSETDPEAQLLAFGLNLSRPPTVLTNESTNEDLLFGTNLRPTRPSIQNGSPVQPESVAMPADDSVGLNDDQGLLPSRPGPRQEDPEAWIGRSDPRSAPFLGERGELLTESELDDHLLISASKECWNTAIEDRCEFDEVPNVEMHSARVRCSIRD